MAGIKMRSFLKEGVTDVKALIDHPMETGRRIDNKTKQVVPAHFIQHVISKHDGRIVYESWFGTGVSAKPFISFRFKGGKKGDPIQLMWFDNKGNSDHAETVIK